MMATAQPTYFPEEPGPWGVDCIGRAWYVIHKDTGRKRRIGRVCGFVPVSTRAPNYFERAMEEAARRNRKEGESK